MDGDVHFGRPMLIRAEAYPVTDYLFKPANGGFGLGRGGVPGHFLSGRSPVLGDKL